MRRIPAFSGKNPQGCFPLMQKIPHGFEERRKRFLRQESQRMKDPFRSDPISALKSGWFFICAQLSRLKGTGTCAVFREKQPDALRSCLRKKNRVPYANLLEASIIEALTWKNPRCSSVPFQCIKKKEGMMKNDKARAAGDGMEKERPPDDPDRKPDEIQFPPETTKRTSR